ncbi:hypothetical protein F5B20DRAFT_226556 [Whalleya microplaca]|nr:hypothetical protein F5B20DRAFT_226556 [Whalleya microplaca]
MYDLDLENVLCSLVEVIREAGNVILSAHPSATGHACKKNSTDIVTETDKAVEALISQRLQHRHPSVAFVGEETYKNDLTITDIPTFVVDPIDGTSNFIHRFPDVCISIALVVNRLPTIGVVYNPFQDELWSAVKGCGAYTQRAGGEMQKLPLSSTPLRGLQHACIGLEWGSDREGPNFELNLKVFTTLARTVKTGGKFVNSLRFSGSAALAICRIAAGQQDIFWECGCWPWDVAAAWCILLEVGGIVVDGHPGNWHPAVDNRRYLAVRAAPYGQREIVEEFWSVIGDDRSLYKPTEPTLLKVKGSLMQVKDS